MNCGEEENLLSSFTKTYSNMIFMVVYNSPQCIHLLNSEDINNMSPLLKSLYHYVYKVIPYDSIDYAISTQSFYNLSTSNISKVN